MNCTDTPISGPHHGHPAVERLMGLVDSVAAAGSHGDGAWRRQAVDQLRTELLTLCELAAPAARAMADRRAWCRRVGLAGADDDAGAAVRDSIDAVLCDAGAAVYTANEDASAAVTTGKAK